MNYLKSITSTVLQSTGVAYPFSIGERIPGLDSHSSIWDIREGVKRDDGTPLTLFIFDSTLAPFQPGNKDRRVLLQLAKNALKKLRTIRHPNVIKYIDSIETDTHVYIATERVRPLEGVLRDWDTGGPLAGKDHGKGKEEWMGWGVKSVSTALGFLNSPPLSLHHAYLLPTAIFVTPSLEWRLSGFELLTNKDDHSGVLWGLGGVVPGDIGERSAPEVRKAGWGALREADPAQSDAYLLALLLFTLYNPHLPIPTFTSQPSPSSSGALPKSLFPLWKRMLNPNPRTRLTTASFLGEAEAAGYWANNAIVSLVDGLDNFELQSESSKLSLLRIIKESTSPSSQSPFPPQFVTYKILPSLLHSLSLPTAPSSSMLPLVLTLSKTVPEKEYGKLVLDPVVKLWASPDRGTRMALLEGLAEYVDRMDGRTVSEKVWPHLITGFADTVPVIREATVKAIYPLASKLTERILNNDLLRILAKTQTDQEPSIRTNTCILLGRLAPSLSLQTKRKVLVPAFARSLKDPFVHARVAGLMALMATVDCFERDDLAGKVLPNMAFTLVDRERVVREQAFKALNMFIARITEMVKDMPETADPSAMGPITTSQLQTSSFSNNNPTSPNPSASPNPSPLVNTATGAAGALAGWAMSSLTKQLNAGEEHESMSTAGMPGYKAAAPQTNSNMNANVSSSGWGASSPSAQSSTSVGGASGRASDEIFRAPAPKAGKLNVPTRAVPSSITSSTKGLKLGAKKPKMSVADQLAAEAGGDGNGGQDDWDAENAWGSGDLMDVNADDDDWSAFESAPIPEVVVPPPQSYYVTPAQPKPKPKPSPKPTTSPAIPETTAIPSPAPIVHAPKPTKPAHAPSSAVASSPSVKSPTPSEISGVATPPIPSSTPQPSLTAMSKEEKDKEMARRREERKAKIAAMKKGKA